MIFARALSGASTARGGGGGFIGMCRSEQLLLFIIIRHSPPGMPYGFFVRIFFFLFFFFFRRQGFRMITFDRQAGPLQNFNRSHVMVIGRSVSFSDPARPPGGGVGRPKHPKIPPSEKNKFACVSEPHEHFWKKKFSREKGRCFCEKKNSVTKNLYSTCIPRDRPHRDWSLERTTPWWADMYIDVESEQHFLCTCPKHNSLRDDLMQQIRIDMNNDIGQLCADAQLKYLSCTKDIRTIVGKFIISAHQNRL